MTTPPIDPRIAADLATVSMEELEAAEAILRRARRDLGFEPDAPQTKAGGLVTVDAQYLKGLEWAAELTKECLVRMEDAVAATQREATRMRGLLDGALQIIKKDHPKDFAEAMRIVDSRQ